MANKRLNALITIGGAVSGTLKTALGSTKAQLLGVGDAVRKLEREQRTLSNAIGTFARMGKDVSSLRARYATVTSEIERQRAALARLKALEDARSRNLARREQLKGKIGETVAMGVAAVGPVVAAAKFEKAMLGVAKQVEGSRDKDGKLTQVYFDMAKQIQELGREIPIATNEIAEMVAAGARMGVAKNELIDFTKTAAMMASAFDLPAGELADDMGKIAGLFKIPIPAIGQLADSINYLDDNSISKGKDIIEFLTRTGGVASSVKITGQEMAALGSTLLTLGERTETASTATNAMFQKLAAADKGTKKFKEAMQEIGLSTGSIQKGMQKDATGTMMKVLTAIGKLPKDKQLGVMVELVGLEHSDTLAKLANNVGEYEKQLKLASSAEAKGSMSREFQAQRATTMAQWEIMKNRTMELAVNIGSVLLPAVNSLFGAIGSVVTPIAEWAREHPKLTQGIVGTLVALTSLRVAMLAGGLAATFIKGGVLNLIGVGMRLLPVLRMVGTAILWVGRAMMLNPIGAIITAIAVGAYLIYTNWEPIKAFMVELWDIISVRAGIAWDTIKTVLSFHPYALIYNNWEPIRGFFTGLWDDITSTARQAFDWILGKINAIGEGWQRTKAFFGFGGSEASAAASAPATPPGAPALPTPQLAAARGASNVMTDQRQYTFNIQQQPGQDGRALAEQVKREMDRMGGISRRGALVDAVGAQ